jgi:NAD-dependent SIR2 family protein deacetylase
MKFDASTAECIQKLKLIMQGTDTILIGAGAGLSTAAGFIYDGEIFEREFADFIKKYHFSDMYSAGFYPYDTLEEYWAYWSRYIYCNRYDRSLNPLYQALFSLVKDKDYFVLTTNVDHLFQENNFSKQRLFYTQGDYGLWQCSEPCHQKTYDNEAIIRRMVAEQKNMRVPSGLVPYCPVCGKPMTMNLRSDDAFVENKGWHAAAKRYEQWLAKHQSGKMLYLELGVGTNTPGIIKFPFWRMTYRNKSGIYASINPGESYVPEEIRSQSICIESGIENVLEELA